MITEEFGSYAVRAGLPAGRSTSIILKRPCVWTG
jgi:hypothetical protein